MIFGRRRERAIFRPSCEHANPRGVAEFFGEVFASLDAHARPVEVEIDLSESNPVAPIVLDIDRGVPVFRQDGAMSARARLRGRWLAEHDVPLTFAVRTRFRLDAAKGERVFRVS